MKKSILILFVTVLLVGAALPSRAQQIVRFNPDYALSEVRADYGLYTPMSVNGRGAKYFGIDYSRRFFGHLAWEAGAQYRLSAVESIGTQHAQKCFKVCTTSTSGYSACTF